jgi:energy-coupling factor transport system substrate-specific component
VRGAAARDRDQDIDTSHPVRRVIPRAAIRVRPRSVITIAMATFLGLVAFLWPFVVAPGTFASTETPPLMFGVLLVLVLAVVFAEVADGGIDAKAIAMLGVLSAINAALRPLGAGTAGIETVFFILVLAGRVFGAGFGFALGCTSMFASALLTGGVGPWLPYQMFGCAWVAMLAGLLPQMRGKAEILMLAAYGAIAGYLFGFMLNLSFWPFSLDPSSSVAYQPGLPFAEQWHRYLLFDATTSLGWDTGRAITNVLAILLAGPAVLAAFRRAARRANFRPAVTFSPAQPAMLSKPPSPSGGTPTSRNAGPPRRPATTVQHTSMLPPRAET